MWGIFLFLFIVCYAKNFMNKLVALLIMEVIFLYMILHTTLSFSSSQALIFYIIMAFMVLDSMMGITLLICSTRNTSVMSSLFMSF